ncbi:hypothetical protein DFH06DRAFT_1233771 [Mycena polygramma]|nr:hypothetical protein DFH06DRAFT_1233771 [Mycena polygramma]
MTSVTRPAAPPGPPSDLPVPNSAPSHDMRVSALARALDLAREAVQLDSTTEQPQAAIAAYGRSVALLREVIASADREEEIRRLQNIVCLPSCFWLCDGLKVLLTAALPCSTIPIQTACIYSASSTTSRCHPQPPPQIGLRMIP